MLFTSSKNIDLSRITRIFKIAKYIQLPCGSVPRFTRDHLKILNFQGDCSKTVGDDRFLVSKSKILR